MDIPNNSLGANNKSSFNLVFGTEVVIPVEIGLSIMRANLNLLEETENQAHLKMTMYRQKVARYNNIRVRSKTFRLGDLIPWHAKVSRSME